MIKTYIFDFDGTIADTLQLTLDILSELRTTYRYTGTSSDYLEILRNEGARALFGKFNLSESMLKNLLNDLKNKEVERMDQIRVFPQVGEVLRELKEYDNTIGILTNNTKQNVETCLINEGVNIFDFIVTKNDLFGKEEILRRIIAENNLVPEQTAYIGDEDRDTEASKKAGIVSVGVTWGFNSEKLLLKTHPTYLIKSAEQLLKLR